MTAKIEIVERLGETAVLLPTLIGDALAANDRIKLRLSLLQDAKRNAQTPGRSVQPFDGSSLTDLPADAVTGARLLGPERLSMHGASALLAGLGRDLSVMAAPFRTGGDNDTLVQRAQSVANGLPSGRDDQIALRDIDALASADRDGQDSFHLLVMDLHKALNRLAVETAVETLDGAHVHGLEADDRAAVKAFMCVISLVIRNCSASLVPGSSQKLISRSYTILARASAAILLRRSTSSSPVIFR